VKSGFFISDFSDLKMGDSVVHTDHGVGIYRGLQRLEIGEECGDYLLIEYLGNDKLYLPVDRIKLVQKYVGTEGSTPKVDRLGSTAWKKTKKKIKTSIRAMAKELLDIYASRKLLKGFSFSSIDHYYREFEATFPYEETPDQLVAIEDVMKNMDEAKPMDRLICGDVGYGKTEVALRSSFRAAMDGKQVAILVPTTVLAQQHYQTFCERLEPYPIEVEMLSRFRNRTEQKRILKQLEDGQIDIIIGTHRLIQKDVHFKDLGLVVVDEEQRFGVAHKERFKKMRKLVDVLTLTATPIPRTLYLSLIEARDMSVISTPPEDRLAIKTSINRFDAEVVREAIVRELRRGGQVFFVHDRVRSIPAMARYLSELVPEAKLAIAHGQMSEKQLEKVMLSFIKKEVNLLLSTTIIESGLDFPSANTIVINRADKLGLAQLYQLRGRVGRSKYRAYCYLLVPGESVLSKEAKERLQAIFEFSELGSSFRLATRDLEIRGAGNILGSSQSGHIAAIGLDLYTQLMEETVKELKGEEVPPAIDTEINLSIPAFIPEEYIGDVNQRLVIYKRLASCMDDREVEEVKEELTDRYGILPPVVDDLMEIITFKNFLRQFLVSSIDYNGREIILTFHPQARGSLEKILSLIESDSKRFKLSPELKLSIGFKARDGKEIMGEVKKLLQ
jgi:transcription-repair coupling factor (superfamily II helicase)